MEVKKTMKHFSLVNTAICGALFLAALNIPTVRADEWDKRTTVSFSDSVQVPGVTLPAGTYIFKLAESNADRYVVQIFNERESHIYATLLAIPNYHLTTPDKTQISFYEVPSGQPPALKAWFYPGDNYGRQFVYPKGEAALISEAAHENVPVEGAAVAETASTLNQPAPVATNESTTTNDQSVTTETKTTESVSTEPTETPVTEQPKTDETTTTTTEVTTEDQTAQPQPQPTPTPTNDQPTTSSDQSTTTLPSTATDWPLVGLIGLCSIAGAFALRMFARSLS
jgi:hypothetical protein